MNDNRPKAYSVGEFTHYLKHLLESDGRLMDIWVSGEISNLTKHSSGHVYFSIKDEVAQVSCAMFKSVAMRYYRDLPGHGEKIIARGRVSVYPPRGSYQLVISELRKEGVGDLHQQFLELREKLRKEGLFESAHKKAIPAFPKVIGVATSPTGAVIRDILNTLRRRYPHVKVVLAPTAVQGPGAAESIVNSLQTLESIPEIDTIILARGGGSLEDLWCFNEQKVARTIFELQKPLISGVGHETDVTIADFVADLRASTPTAAAEQAVPDAEGIRQWLDDAARKLRQSLQHFIDFRRQMLDDYSNRLKMRMESRIQNIRHELALIESKMQGMDMRNVLERGFSVTLHEGKTIKSAADLKAGDQIETVFYKGRTTSKIEEVKDE